MSELNEKCCNQIEGILNGIGKIIIGLAAFVGACKAPEAIKEYAIAIKIRNTQNNKNNLSVNIYNQLRTALNNYSTSREKIRDPKKLEDWLESMPVFPSTGAIGGTYIRPEYRPLLLEGIKSKKTLKEKDELLKYYIELEARSSSDIVHPVSDDAMPAMIEHSSEN